MSRRVLAAHVVVGGRSFAPGESPEKEFADQITNPKAWEGGDAPQAGDGDSDESAADKGYADRKVDELQAEADERGLEVEGSGKDGKVLKADLVAALEADDASE